MTRRRYVITELLDSDPFLTTDEVALMFRVKRRTVSRWAQDGRLPGQKAPGGRGWLFRTSVVHAALERGGPP